jgi:hypothetical protein
VFNKLPPASKPRTVIDCLCLDGAESVLLTDRQKGSPDPDARGRVFDVVSDVSFPHRRDECRD